MSREESREDLAIDPLLAEVCDVLNDAFEMKAISSSNGHSLFAKVQLIGMQYAADFAKELDPQDLKQFRLRYPALAGRLKI